MFPAVFEKERFEHFRRSLFAVMREVVVGFDKRDAMLRERNGINEPSCLEDGLRY